jgi:acyl carrier protein
MADDVEETVRSIVQRIGKLQPGFSASADLSRELGVKSAAALDLLLTMEEELGIAISDEAFSEARTLDKLIALARTLKGQES